MNDLSRRRFVLGTGAVAVTGALAGCGGNGNGNGGGNGNGNGGGSDGGNGGGSASPEEQATSYLNENEANGFEGEISDQTGQSEVTVEVGAGPNGFQFAPAAISVDTGTTVTWEWTGEGGQHNVVSNGGDYGDLESERIAEEGHTYTYTFEEAGAALYVCEPHRAQGKYGAVVVQ
jgi:serine/threonine-protein kinase